MGVKLVKGLKSDLNHEGRGEVFKVYTTGTRRRFPFYWVNSDIMKMITSALKHVATVWGGLLMGTLMSQTITAQTSRNYRLKDFDYPVSVYQWDYARASGSSVGLNWSASTFVEDLGKGDEGLFNGPGLFLSRLFPGGHLFDAQAAYNFGPLSHYPVADRVASRVNGQLTVAHWKREEGQEVGPLYYARLPANKAISGYTLKGVEVNVMTMIQVSGGLSYHPMQYGTRNVLAHTGIVWSRGTATYVEVNGEGFAAQAVSKELKANLLWYPNLSIMKFPGLEVALGLHSFDIQHPINKSAWYRNVLSRAHGEVFIGFSPFTNTGPNGQTQVYYLFGFRSGLVNIGGGTIN